MIAPMRDAILALLLIAGTYAVAAGLGHWFPDPPLDCASMTELARLYAPTYADHRDHEACQLVRP